MSYIFNFIAPQLLHVSHLSAQTRGKVSHHLTDTICYDSAFNLFSQHHKQLQKFMFLSLYLTGITSQMFKSVIEALTHTLAQFAPLVSIFNIQ